MYDELVKRLHQRIALTTAGSPLQDDLIEAANAIESMCEMVSDAYGTIANMEADKPRWIPVSERPPEDLEEVNITFTNLEPEPYYNFIKGKRFTGSAVFYKGEWYWYSSVTVDVLKEYGRYESEKIDDGIKIVAWQPLPEPYREDKNE